jgi:hypothetical protein
MSQSATLDSSSVVIPNKTKKAVDAAVSKLVKKSVENAVDKMNQSTDGIKALQEDMQRTSETITPPSKNVQKSLGLNDENADKLKQALQNKNTNDKFSGQDEKTQKAAENNKIFNNKTLRKIAPNVVGKSVDFILDSPNSAKFKQNDSFQRTSLDSVATPIADEAAIGIPGSLNDTEKALIEAARIVKKEGEPVARAATKASVDAMKSSSDYLEDSYNQLKTSVTYMNDATTTAEKSIKQAAKYSKIDPDKYLKNLGVGGKLLASIGMVLSGAGSGLSGQPNLAVEVFQRNIDRDIQAQQKTYENLMEKAAKDQGMMIQAKDRKLLATNAYFAAQQSVLAGAQAALENVGALTKFSSAVEIAKSIKFNLQQQSLKSLGDYSSFYKTVHASGDEKNMNLMGVGAAAVSDHLLGTNLGLDNRGTKQRVVSATPGSESVFDPNPTVMENSSLPPPPPLVNKKNNFYNSYQSPYYTLGNTD